jgi:cysteine desulfurase
MRRIYMDYTATTPVDGRVVDAMLPYFGGVFGNASSIHSFGREAKAALESSRERIAALIGARSSELYFTSGGTESDNSALTGIASKYSTHGKRHIVISSIEHHAILHAAESLKSIGVSVTQLNVDSQGFISPEELGSAITKETFLVSVIHANNEIGTIQNLKVLAGIAHENGALFHTDAVQSFGKTSISMAETGVDLASFTAHKIYGPKGIGALFIKRGIDFEPTFHGGAQERNRRPGTESVPLAVGYATAAELAARELATEQPRLATLNRLMRNRIEAEVPGARFNSPVKESVPNILSVSIDSNEVEIDGEALIINMDLEGVAVTSGSACSSGSLQPSHVIKALGRDNRTTMATVRFSIGRFTTEEDVQSSVDIFAGVVARIGKKRKVSSPVS